MFLPDLETETETAEKALVGASGRADAIGRFVRAVGRFHLSDLNRFRMMYIVPQTARGRRDNWTSKELIGQVHPITDRLYAALAGHLDAPGNTSARAQAASVHAAVLGTVLMVALADALDDPLKHPNDAMLSALIESLTADYLR